MSVVTRVILDADNELRYPTIGELQGLQNYFSNSNERINISCILRDKQQDIIRLASKAVFQIHPEYIAPGGNAEGARKRSLCLRDYGWYLRLVSYGVLSGDKQFIETLGIIGVKEMYNSLGVPILGMVDSIECLKNASLEFLSDTQANCVIPYFNFIIKGMSN
uniref:Allophycocyanin gamma subunit n=1 Tax=Pleurostichidium falkenbergii TaxID=121064 RepID=A0A4D6UYF9_9FLOR|nr:allophycocyanin gamma subunit [Pleurostichidium falkenbergii]QCH39570.1 allophycocyanin gamma subunit [Pleurostichidium falkenbergii]